MPGVEAPRAQRTTQVGQVRRLDGQPRPIVGKDSLPQAGAATQESRRPAVTPERRAPLNQAPSAQRIVPRPVGSGFSLEKALVGLGFAVALVLVVLFGTDLIWAWPLGRYTPVAEAVFCGCALVLGYLSWDAYRDLR